MGISDAIKKFTDDFFDDLKAGATNRAIDQAKKNKDNKIPYSLVAKSKQIDDAAKQIEDMLKELE
jgi:hypothetical protein